MEYQNSGPSGTLKVKQYVVLRFETTVEPC